MLQLIDTRINIVIILLDYIILTLGYITYVCLSIVSKHVIESSSIILYQHMYNSRYSFISLYIIQYLNYRP